MIQLIVLIILISLIIYAVQSPIFWSFVIIVIGLSIAGSIFKKKKAEERLRLRRESLLQKYRDQEIVDRILSKQIWQHQTEEQLTDSLGSPLDIDQKVLKSKKKEVWKYQYKGTNRYGLRVILENGLVVGWEQK